MKTLRFSVRALLCACLTAIASSAVELNVFAAASLSDALKDMARDYEKSSGDKVRFNFGSSSLLARQIKEGAPADLFFSADEAKMDDLAKAGLLAENTRRTLLSNTLVIVVNAETPAIINSPADLGTDVIRRLALGETRTVPVGIYAKTFLQTAGLWDRVVAKVIPTENVRAALAVVENGNAEAGIVYKSDVITSTKVVIAYEVPIAESPGIAYPIAVIATSKQIEAARRLALFFSSRDAWTSFEKYGFLKAD